MLKWLKDFMGVKEGRETVEPIPLGMAKQERVSGDQAIEIGTEMEIWAEGTEGWEIRRLSDRM